MNWSKWNFFENLNKLPKISTVYQIRCLDKSSKPIVIFRAGDKDKNGILDIGHTNNLRIRMTDFWGAARGNPSYSHSAAWRFYEYNLKKFFPLQKLQFRYLVQRDKSSAKTKEKRELNKYGKKFLELPPLNSQK